MTEDNHRPKDDDGMPRSDQPSSVVSLSPTVVTDPNPMMTTKTIATTTIPRQSSTHHTTFAASATSAAEEATAAVVTMKKKARYSRTEKRERKQQQQQQQQLLQLQPKEEQEKEIHRVGIRPEGHGPPTTKRKSRSKKTKVMERLSLVETIRDCAIKAMFTQAVVIDDDDGGGGCVQSNVGGNDVGSSSSIRIISSCDLDMSMRQKPPFPLSTSTITTVRVRPLLILDLNGVLCHRSRYNEEPEGVRLRPSVGMVAKTPIIPRSDVTDMLRYLDQHFCLAVWTSAKRKTALKLITLLVPQDIRERFLFVWHQSDCHAVVKAENGKEQDVIFEKHLYKVWKEYPLWSADNTLLIDDSPDKCPFAVANAVHPPPLNGWYTSHGGAPPIRAGLQSEVDCNEDGPDWMAAVGNSVVPPPNLSDEDNQRVQADFFRNLVRFWTEHPYESTVDDAETRSIIPPVGAGPTASAPVMQLLVSTTDSKNNWKCQHLNEQDSGRALDSQCMSSEMRSKQEYMANTKYYNFLQSYERSIMGWRTGTIRE